MLNSGETDTSKVPFLEGKMMYVNDCPQSFTPLHISAGES